LTASSLAACCCRPLPPGLASPVPSAALRGVIGRPLALLLRSLTRPPVATSARQNLGDLADSNVSTTTLAPSPPLRCNASLPRRRDIGAGSTTSLGTPDRSPTCCRATPLDALAFWLEHTSSAPLLPLCISSTGRVATSTTSDTSAGSAKTSQPRHLGATAEPPVDSARGER